MNKKTNNQTTYYGIIAQILSWGFLSCIIVLIGGLFFWQRNGYPFEEFLGYLLTLLALVTLRLVCIKQKAKWSHWFTFLLVFALITANFIIANKDEFNQPNAISKPGEFNESKIADFKKNVDECITMFKEIQNGSSVDETVRKLDSHLAALGGSARALCWLEGGTEKETTIVQNEADQHVQQWVKALKQQIIKAQDAVKNNKSLEELFEKYFALIAKIENRSYLRKN